MTETNAIQLKHAATDQSRAVRIMAKALFQQLQLHGYSRSHVIDFTSELLELLTESIRTPGTPPTQDAAIVLFPETVP